MIFDGVKMALKTNRLIFSLGLFSVMGLLLSGCSTPELKGTPYYSSETDTDTQAAKDRIPLWPILYYKSPTLSVLWPFFEKSDEYMALRPLCSVHGLDKSKKIYSLLWPLGQFDRVEQQNRFFPMFWGDGYVVGFPLYWHFGHPFGNEGGTDALIPAWCYAKSGRGYSLNILWPFINVKDTVDGRGWRVWPLAGGYSNGDDGYYRFMAWPFCHQWGTGTYEKGEAVLPLYCRGTSGQETWFYSLLYSRYRATDRRWDLLFPAYYNRQQGDRRTLITMLGGMSKDKNGLGWVVFPLLSGGIKTQNSSETWVVGPLAHFGQRTNAVSNHVFPFYYSSSNQSSRMFLSIPWSSSSARDGSGWKFIPPFMLRIAQGKDHQLYTPLYTAGTRHEGAETWKSVHPLWYQSEGPDGKTLATLVGGWQTRTDGRSWLIWPLLSGQVRTADSRDLWVVAPLFHWRRDMAGVSHHLLPFYWWDGRDDRLISPLVAQWSNAQTGAKKTVVPPLLTYYSATPKVDDLWTGAGLAHFSWGEEAGSSHIVPLYYQDRTEGTFISLPWSRWTWKDTSTNTLIAPLLSWMTHRRDRTDLWMVGPLAHVSWGKKAGASHVFPLFYRDKDEDAFISLPYSHWNRGESEYDLYPPLFAMMTHEGKEKQLDALLGLFSERWGGEQRQGYFLPFYYHDNGRVFYSLLFGWNHRDPDDGFYYPLTPLLGVRTGKHSGGWLFPLWSRDYDQESKTTTGTVLWGTYSRDSRRSEAALIPVFGYKNRGSLDTAMATNSWNESYGKTFWSLPACWYRNTLDVAPVKGQDGKPTGKMDVSFAKDNGFFPLWSYTHLRPATGPDQTYGSLLMVLYDYKTTLGAGLDGAQTREEYVRKRVLWRLYHYERHNEDVSVDIFPAITYDRTKDGFQRWAFLWRAFRYERGPEGKKLDLLFIPLIRSEK
ncbi:MAG: hypothetical protein WCI95_05980 [bacterium]